MKHIPIPSELFTLNRRRLVQQLLPRSLAVLNANDIMPTNADGSMGHLQNADLFYLTGIHQEETILVLAPDAFDEKHREIRQEGFLPCTYDPFTRLLRQAPDTASGNVIYVRDLSGANAILKSAPAFQFDGRSI